MDVAFYHDDPSNRLSASYDPQSSPGSVDSISSTDAGPVCAIATVPPPYRDQRYGQEFLKAGSLKSMNVDLQNGNTPYSTQQQQISSRTDPRYNNSGLTQSAASSIVSSDSFHISSSTYTSVNQQHQASTPASSASANNLTLNIPECSAVSASLSTPDLVNMLKVSPDFDQMLMQYSQGSQMTSQVYSRSLAQEQEMYAQNYAREVARQKTHGGSNPDLASSNQLANVETSQHLPITSGSGVALSHPQFVPPESYYSREQSHEGPSTSAFGLSGTTIHHIGNPNSLQPGHAVIMSPHVSMVPPMKEELPQTVPVVAKSRPMSPIDMEQQEVIKTERKRMRNRLAASKCRKRKLERISRLEEKVNSLKNQNLELSTNANLLRQQVAELKSKVMAHVNSGCQLMMSQQQVTF